MAFAFPSGSRMPRRSGGLRCCSSPHASICRTAWTSACRTVPAHLAYLKGLGSRVKIGGALLAVDHTTPVGSMVIFEAESEDEVLALRARDPYSSVGLFESVSVRPWRPGVGQSLV